MKKPLPLNVLVAMLLMFVVAACGGDEKEEGQPTISLIGTWTYVSKHATDGTTEQHALGGDKTVAYKSNNEVVYTYLNSDGSNYQETGTYTYDGTTKVLTETIEGIAKTYEVTKLDATSLVVTQVSGDWTYTTTYKK